ncbi:hypothetical protein ACFW6C_07430 [Streptomyces fungicidicus]
MNVGKFRVRKVGGRWRVYAPGYVHRTVVVADSWGSAMRYATKLAKRRTR